MHRIISLLDQKNHYLEKFYSLNEEELLNFAQKNFDHLEEFYRTREEILNLIRYIDQELDKLETAELSSAEKRHAQEALAIKEEYVTRILAQDLEILSCIESAKSSIIRELQEIKRTKKAVGSYKSKTTVNRLDEEA
jgi:hypothetical protein